MHYNSPLSQTNTLVASDYQVAHNCILINVTKVYHDEFMYRQFSHNNILFKIFFFI